MTSYCNLPILCAVCLMVAFVAPVAGVSPDEEREPKLQASEAASAETVATKVVRVVYDPETGEIMWEFRLAPAEKKELQLKYAVKYPKGRNLIIE